jgi:phosphatidate cytidylyltransferase
VADDKRNGDDLFEDLDKFFAPIKDVDWDEPASAGPPETPSEEHVSVRPDEHAAGGDPAIPTVSEGIDDPSVVSEEDASWYDTSVLDTIDGLDDSPDIVGIDESIVSVTDEPPAEPHAGQSDLFAGEDDDVIGPDTDTADWPVVDDDAASSSSSSYEDHPHGADEPSEGDVATAAEHFATSMRDEDRDEDPTVDPFGEVAEAQPPSDPDVGADLLGDSASGDVEDDILSDLHGPEDAPQTVMVSEGLGGPSWQEPTSVEVGADLEARRGTDPEDRDVPAAFLTGVVLAGVAFGTLLLGKGLFAIVATAVVLLAQGELYGVMVKRRHQPATAIGLITGVLMMAGAYFHGEAAVLAMFSLGVIATFLWFMAMPAPHRKDTLLNVGLTLLNVAWIPLLASYLLITLDQVDGRSLVIAVIGLTFVFDTAAFLGGSVTGGQFFQRPLAPTVSPKKSIEGLIIATLVTAFVSVALVTEFVKPFENLRIDTLLLALVVAAAATFGDLAESLIKRDLGIKDMSSALPGHGGVLDRIDSLLFVAPAAFLFFRIVFA